MFFCVEQDSGHSIICHTELLGGRQSFCVLLPIFVGINSLLTASNKSWFGDQIKDLINKIKRKKQHSKAYKRAKKELSYYLHRIVKIFFNQLPKEVGLIVVERLKNLKKGKGKWSKGFRACSQNMRNILITQAFLK